MNTNKNDSEQQLRARLAAAVHRIEGIRQGIGASEELADLYDFMSDNGDTLKE